MDDGLWRLQWLYVCSLSRNIPEDLRLQRIALQWVLGGIGDLVDLDGRALICSTHTWCVLYIQSGRRSVEQAHTWYGVVILHGENPRSRLQGWI